MESYIVFAFSIVIAHIDLVQSHVCVLDKKPDPSRGAILRWSLPYAEICRCQGVVAPVFTSSCARVGEEYDDGDLWFVDDPRQLTKRHNWRRDKLDKLMDRTVYCENQGDVKETSLDDRLTAIHATSSHNDVYLTSLEDMEDKYPTASQGIMSSNVPTTNSFSTYLQSTLGLPTTSEPVCYDYLGMGDGDIPNANIQASATSYDWKASDGRLNGPKAWSAHPDPVLGTQWIQADIGYQTYASGVITQGDGGVGAKNNWVTSFIVSTFLNAGSNETFVTNKNETVVIYPGNVDINSEVTATFPEPQYARIVRITCLTATGSGYFSMRFEILGCKR